MDTSQKMAIEWECLGLINAFAYLMDHRHYQKLAELFTEDGVFFRDGEKLTGQAEIVDALARRPAIAVVRHVTTGHYFTEVSETSAIAQSTNRSYFGMSDGSSPTDLKPENMSLLDFRDTFRKTDSGWRIAERKTDLILLSDAIRPIFGLPPRQPA